METAAIKERLAALGLTKAAAEVERKASLMEKLTLAYEQYLFVTKEQVEKFNQQLRAKTEKQDSWGNRTYQELTFTDVSAYGQVPPESVLNDLEKAKILGCFDVFEIAQITEKQVPKPDPILFARIHGCDDRFFVSQWDSDVSIEDLISWEGKEK